MLLSLDKIQRMPPIREFITACFPRVIANPCIAVGKMIKAQLRRFQRLVHRDGIWLKRIKTCGVSFYIELRPLENGCVDSVLVQTGRWEPELARQIVKCLRKGDTFVDVGANIGHHTLLASSYLSGTGKIYSFEPITRIARQMERSIKANGFANVTINAFGLGNSTEELMIHVRDKNVGNSSIGAYKDLSLDETSSLEKIAIKRLDDILDPDEEIRLIKIDVEGYELEVLQGAELTLTRHHPILLLEFSPVFYEYDRPGKSLELVSYLEFHGYTFATIDGQSIDLRAWMQAYAGDAYLQIDILCQPSPTGLCRTGC